MTILQHLSLYLEFLNKALFDSECIKLMHKNMEMDHVWFEVRNRSPICQLTNCLNCERTTTNKLSIYNDKVLGPDG